MINQLLDCDDDERRARHGRVQQALADFDAATIATIHQFCSMVLDSLGVAGDTDARAQLVENLDETLVEVVEDLYLRAFARDNPSSPTRRRSRSRETSSTTRRPIRAA